MGICNLISFHLMTNFYQITKCTNTVNNKVSYKHLLGCCMCCFLVLPLGCSAILFKMLWYSLWGVPLYFPNSCKGRKISKLSTIYATISNIPHTTYNILMIFINYNNFTINYPILKSLLICFILLLLLWLHFVVITWFLMWQFSLWVYIFYYIKLPWGDDIHPMYR